MTDSRLLKRFVPIAQSVRALPGDLRAAKQVPILVVGLPRSGTTWLASTLAKADGVRYFHEPFNVTLGPEVRAFHMRYVRAADRDPAFEQHARAAFAGRGVYNGHAAPRDAHALQQNLWWPSRHLVKDVHACLALDWISHHLRPRIVIALRHPCAMASSWARLRGRFPDDWHWQGSDAHLQVLLAQPALMDDHLASYRDVMNSAKTYFEKLGAFWGASNYVMLQQHERHPDWIVVQHETLCVEPEQAYRTLFEDLDLRWTQAIRQQLAGDTTVASDRPYALKRVSEQEPGKWRDELTEDQAEQVLRFARPFELPFDLDFELA
ncbi:MAG: sulfotransferase [Bacteroidota bacterium]